MIASSRHNVAKSAKLGAAVLAAFACATWRIRAAMMETPPTHLGKVVAIGGKRPSSPGLVGTAVLRDHEDRAEDWMGQDPFRPFDTETVGPPAESALKGAVAPLTSLPSGPIAPVTAGGLPSVAYAGRSEHEVATPSPSVKLTGVVVGARPTAVVLVGDEETVIRPGERLPDGSTLVRIDQTCATFVRAGRKSILWVAD